MIRYILMYMGVLPFIGSAFLIAKAGIDLPLGLDAQKVIGTYALLIGAFMAGVHWGQHLEKPPIHPTALIILSNVVALAFWFSYLLLNSSAFLIVAAIMFLVILLIDLLMAKHLAIEKTYAIHRSIVTGMVIASLAFASSVTA
ncbi:MAG: DUF3429 domain-containing protein [Rhodospirillaceae bacterium]